jgi:hypothetical protein
MKITTFMLLFSLFQLTFAQNSTDFPLTSTTTVKFADKKTTATLLAKKDDFLQALSDFDRSARMQVAKIPTEVEFQAFVQQQCLDWHEWEIKLVTDTLKNIQKRLAPYNLSLPAEIYLARTSGKEESYASYTRMNVIILPEKTITDAVLGQTIMHELFHVLSRNNPRLRDSLYQIIGFQLCKDFKMPESLQKVKITNPDAPQNIHYTELEKDGKKVKVIPFLYTKMEKYDETQQAPFFFYIASLQEWQAKYQELKMVPTFLAVEEKNGKIVPILEKKKPVLWNMWELKGYDETEFYTGYLIHPEEIMAENFVAMLMNKKNPITEKIEVVLKK